MGLDAMVIGGNSRKVQKILQTLDRVELSWIFFLESVHLVKASPIHWVDCALQRESTFAGRFDNVA